LSETGKTIRNFNPEGGEKIPAGIKKSTKNLRISFRKNSDRYAYNNFIK
jgi:hypothetical protein